ncbi:MAG: glutamate synthase large subunit, partial [Candidatus Margulisbacteria bacterium]|nr:glutamate synthase large subunit [Candidatus Margulisiibacteriota bacterium]
ILNSNLIQKNLFYFPSFSSRIIVYKGMLTPQQVQEYFIDLQNKKLESAIALVHSRFSTNTFPSWDLAQPFRILAHNGEINTIKGNRFWMQARESMFQSDLLGEDVKKILPVIEPDKSDSASFDNALEMLVMTGRSLPHALMMLIPESWNDKNPIPDDLKAFYEYHSTFMEPWDGPASMVFCDGRYVGGTLDRNGLRPSRYVITNDDLIVMGSEIGVQAFPADKVKYKGRLQPGKLLFVDTEEGRIIPDQEVKNQIAHQQPYKEWVESNRINLKDIKLNGDVKNDLSQEELHNRHLVFGYTREDIDVLIKPMAEEGKEPTGSMGTDIPLAVLSDKPQRLFNYFKQIFAQVTNPAIDPIREELVMSLTSYIGTRRNLLKESPQHCRMIKILHPILTNHDIEKLRQVHIFDFKTKTLQIIFSKKEGPKGLQKAINDLCKTAEEYLDKGLNFLILSDKEVDEDYVPIPALLACAAVHHHLIRKQKRKKAALIIETADAREVMHFALLFAYGADAINPYLSYATLTDLVQQGALDKKIDYAKAETNYIKAIEKGLLKVLSKMGTSTLRSYRGAQIVEAVGLNQEVIDTCFTGTASRIGGIGFEEIAQEALAFHQKAYEQKPKLLESAGVYQYRKDGEKHAWNPETIYLLQWAARTGDYNKYQEFASIVNKQVQDRQFIRGLLEFKKQKSIPIEEVEAVDKIMTRFVTGAMSYGSISKEAHEAMAMALNKIGGKSNTGEGGEDPERFKDNRRSAIKQIASGRFGVTNNYLTNADEIQIKIAQGAKPGEGGQLPGHKVNQIIAKTRFSTPGVTLISPPPHHDIYSIEDLAQLIFDLKNVNPKARISVKLVSEAGVGTVAAGVAKGYADMILISGYDGGTGASPISSIKHAGLPWELGISETHQTLVLNELRSRVRLQTDGQLKTGRDVVLAALLGAEEFGFSTAALIVLGCVMMRKCHQNTCPVGVATQDPELRKRFKGRSEYLVNYFHFIAQEVREIMAELGIKKFDDLVGRTDLLQQRKIDHWKAGKVNLDLILKQVKSSAQQAMYCTIKQKHKINNLLDHKLIEQAKPALENKKQIKLEMIINNVDRTTGAMLSGEVSKRYGEEGLPEDTIQVTFLGSAGQSFGAFLSKGITFRLEGDANDYWGKGLSGGKLIVVPPKGSEFIPEENIIIGNTVLYGATRGEAYVRGVTGERFCVRNSGVYAVLEGAGDHCCEYMTGGRVVVLGKVGRNFAAGMSGGIAYVLDEAGNFDYFCNKGMVEMVPVAEQEDINLIKEMLIKHQQYTESSIAKKVLNDFDNYLPKFVKVMPLEYKRVLEQLRLEADKKRLTQIKKEEQLEEYSDG